MNDEKSKNNQLEHRVKSILSEEKYNSSELIQDLAATLQRKDEELDHLKQEREVISTSILKSHAHELPVISFPLKPSDVTYNRLQLPDSALDEKSEEIFDSVEYLH